MNTDTHDNDTYDTKLMLHIIYFLHNSVSKQINALSMLWHL